MSSLLYRGQFLAFLYPDESLKRIGALPGAQNDTLAARIWPGEDPIGKRLKTGMKEVPDQWNPWCIVKNQIWPYGRESATSINKNPRFC
jgi:hypothetical protein